MKHAVPVIMLLLLGACKPLADEPVIPRSELVAQVRFTYHGQPFQAGDTLRDAGGRLVALERLRFLVGGLWLQDELHQVLEAYPSNHWTCDSNTPIAEHAIGTTEVTHVHVLALTIGEPEAGVPGEDWGGPEGFSLELVLRTDSDGDGAITTADTVQYATVPLTMPHYYAQIDLPEEIVPGQRTVIPFQVATEGLLAEFDVTHMVSAPMSDPACSRLLSALSTAIRAW